MLLGRLDGQLKTASLSVERGVSLLLREPRLEIASPALIAKYHEGVRLRDEQGRY
jgi:hypothetical protein